MDAVAIEELLHGALTLAIVLVIPGLVVAFLVSLIAGFLQAITQMQDQSLTSVPRILLGLVALLLLLPWMLDRLLAQGVARSVPGVTLQNRLLDYQDKDNLYRLNSAEADGYRKAGLPPPTNRPLATPMELLRVMGWAEALSFMPPAEINDTLSVDNVAVVNVNTAPERVLRTIDGVDEDMARRAIAYRKVQPFLTETAFFEFLGLPKSAEAPVAVYPAMSGTLKLWPSHGGQVGVVHWTLTPIEDRGRPWREDYELIQSQATAQDDVAYPVRSRLFAEPVAARK